MVLAFHGDTRTEPELRALLGTSPEGTTIGHLAALAPSGYEVNFYHAELAFLEACLRVGLPPIALLDTGPLPHWGSRCNHAAVVVGVDDAAFTLNDPAFADAPRVVPNGDFLKAWAEHQCVCAVISPTADE